MSDDIQLLLRAHLECQRGFYFDELVELEAGIFSAFSDVITDPYWNFAVIRPRKWEDAAIRSSLQSAFSARSRATAVFFPTELNVDPGNLPGTTSFATEVWMTVTGEELLPPPSKTLTFKLIVDDSDVEQAVEVFADAYTSEVPGAGFTSLPPEYSKAYRRGLMNAKQFGSIQLLGMDSGRPVAVASAFFANRRAGIYNVAVVRDAQRKGFGSQISFEAVNLAFRSGAQSCFLQTEPNGTVEELYRKLGFTSQFTGNLLTLT